ncbi:MAG: hypothetical protein NZ610_02215 [Candidatus Bipolaricaulota bacterium]|nr:hypothetical protein [Candidatus Bipolaricaulota bacterium]MCS7274207.1 hypothetical protein [Candidatus Bipolaricaulota bacterium]MDW8110627.1 hypothetical protein [Candidatus Bipolaricaulota bacterium]MDW8328515.1 hypothetical protein [Candidatus Bipolaricaulota bacterium]
MYETLNSWDLMIRVEHQYRRMLEEAEQMRLWKALQKDERGSKSPQFPGIFELLGVGKNGRLQWKL